MTRLEVGRVARPHALRGEVVVELVTNRSERVAPGTVLTTATDRELRVVASGPAGGGGRGERYIVAFAGVGDRAGADALRGEVLFAEPLEDPDALWVHDLIGATVVDTAGTPLGTVTAVQANPASDLLVLDGGALVPLTFVTSSGGGQITVDPPAGLFDL